MSTVSETLTDHSTLTEKLVASFSGFGFACATFIFSTLVLVPATFYLAGWAHSPEWLYAGFVFFEIFGLTAIAGIVGVLVAERGFLSRRDTDTQSV